jgi:chromate reductase
MVGDYIDEDNMPTTTARDVAVLVGSLRKDSVNRKVANALRELMPPALALEFVEIGALPLYNQDSEADPPPAWTAFRERVRKAEALLFVSPEYNRGMPGVLKNAIDVGSRPPGKSVWGGKPGGVVTASPGTAGGLASHHQLRQSLSTLNVAVLATPEVFLAGADKLFDASGALINDSTRSFLSKFAQAYAGWVERILRSA